MTPGDTVGVIGAGRMGLPMVGNLIDEGYDVSVYDPNPDAITAAAEAGATDADSPADIGEQAEVVLVVVPTSDDVRDVCTGPDGLFRRMVNGLVVVTSSATPSLPADLQATAPNGVAVVDAPMCRGENAAKDGDILFLVGGPSEAIERCRGIFAACGEATVLGGLGAGQVGKTANNLLLWISILGDLEVLRLAEALDIDPGQLRRVLPKSSGDNWAIREGNWENIRLTWPEKDLAIALELADEADSPIPLSGLASQLMKQVDVPDLEPYYLDST